MSIFKKNIKVSSEEELINLAKKNSKYFTPIYNQYHEQIFRFVYQRMKNQDDAADVTSQVFLNALLNLNKYEFRGFPFSSWLYRIAINEVNQHYRKTNNKRFVNVEDANIKDIIEESGADFDEEKREKLLQALASLNQEKLMIIELRFFEKRAFKEIAQVLNITEDNAKVKTYRVLEEMKKRMIN